MRLSNKYLNIKNDQTESLIFAFFLLYPILLLNSNVDLYKIYLFLIVKFFFYIILYQNININRNIFKCIAIEILLVAVHFTFYNQRLDSIIIISSFASSIYLINKNKPNKNYLIFKNLLLMIKLYVFLIITYNFLVYNKNLLDLYNIVNGELMSRSSGLSRLIAIILIYHFYVRSKYIFIVFSALIILLASKVNLTCLIISIALSHLLMTRKYTQAIYSILMLLLGLIIIYSIRVDFYNIRESIEIYNSNGNMLTFNNRLFNWINAINNFSMFGSGIQSDRINFNQSTDNAYLNIILSFGIYGIIIIFYIINQLVMHLKKDSKNFIFITIAIFFILRSFFENSISVYSFDFIFFYIAYKLINYNENKHNNT